MSFLSPTFSMEYGFGIPEGSPGEFEDAARECARCANSLEQHGGRIDTGVTEATSAWLGSAATSFDEFGRALSRAHRQVAKTVAAAGRLMDAFSLELAAAQKATREALRECDEAAAAISTHQHDAATHAATVSSMRTMAAGPVPAQTKAECGREADQAEQQQVAAERAEAHARTELDEAKRSGQRAWEDYQREAQRASAHLQALSTEIASVHALPPGAAVNLGKSGSGIAEPAALALLIKVAKSEKWGDSILGLGEGIAKRVRKANLMVPITAQGRADLENVAAIAREGDPEKIPMLLEAATGSDFAQPGQYVGVNKEDDLASMAPEWAKGAGKALGAVGTAWTLGSTAVDSWDDDSKQHPGWSTEEKINDTAQKTIIVGGMSVVGGVLGAAIGAGAAGVACAETGPGAVICAVGGGVAGGVDGGAVGESAGKWVERHVGHWVDGAMHTTEDAISSTWDRTFH